MKNTVNMKTSISIFLLVICLSLGCACGKPKSSEVVSKEAAKSITVYVTKTGECYHTDKCSCLSKSKIQKKLTEAVKHYRPCQLCYPEIIETN